MKHKDLKVAVIGGGSSYTPELMEGFIKNYDQFPIKQLYLVDVEAGAEKLRIIGELAKRMFEKAGLAVDIRVTLDRREAIKDADFISTQIRVGQLAARSLDERIPAELGMIGQETTGAGGFAKALRTIPVILDICRDIRELAPDAFLINFTNPAGIVTEAVLKYGGVKTIGLCNLPIGLRNQIAELCEVPVSEVQLEWVGINHLNWTTRIIVRGADITEQFLREMAGAGGMTMKNIPDLDWDLQFLQSLGALPCAYHRYYYLRDEMLQEQFAAMQSGGTRAETVMRLEDELFKLYQDPQLAIKPPQLEQRGGAFYSEVAVNLMTAIYNNKGDVQTVNVRNNGIIACLPDDASVEVNAIIDAEGAHPIALSQQPGPQIRGLLQVVKAYEELTVEAAVHGDYDKALQALCIHPLIGSVAAAKQVLDQLLAAHQRYLPQFAL
ncbi:6-phospho-beta-glucosidase [Paenibacillus paridis]|uniref:6-phospho-beta-glucosidase n=1 Tax=Paenibacillus paridis TaxID=2583376 RepID=UPI0011234D29|nr:6-phospho-beta-glucosidase [Paenibacillus paridis]